ncbi:MAG TPA: glycosyltransferase family 2 protein [Thermoanaerobaculia bacterium]|nr:glycosyltransferase family 2 protein [Thermoanaerobaculia bacterium]
MSAAGKALGKVSVAILSWNGRAHLEICLGALARQADPGVPWDIVVLDNGSSDGTVEWLRTAHPEVRVVASSVNLGFCAGNNRLVAETDGDAIALLNNDTRPAPDWLAALVAALAAAPPDVAAVSGRIVDWPGERLDFARGVMTFDGHAFQLDFRRPLAEARIPAAGDELLFACGGNMLVRRRSFLDAGGFDEGYFAYLEDVDLGWRLWAGGERVTFAPDALVHHRSSATSDLLGLFNRGFLFERNAFLTAYKNYEAGLWERVMPALLLTFLSRTQTMLVDNNPGGGSLTVDPYAGWIANTAGPAATPSPGSSGVPPHPAEPWTVARVLRKLREHGPRESARRGWARLQRRILPAPAAAGPASPCLTDERTVAQFRALSYLLRHLDTAAERRAWAQRRRRRSDREIFERFPLYLVPTYPGDEALFASPGFQAWLPPDLPLVRCRLAEVMDLKG